MESRRLMIVVLAALFVVGLALSLGAAWRAGDWWEFVLSLGTELVGAVVTYFLFDQFIERSRAREKERKAESQRLEIERARLIAELGSRVNDVAVAAADTLRRRYWLFDGSLHGAKLGLANLQGANLLVADLSEADMPAANLAGVDLAGGNLSGAILLDANLQGAFLGCANLQGANLVNADLQGANLWFANLQGADLHNAEFDESTTLPDGTKWTPDTDMARFTDSDYPHFWRSDYPDSPANWGEGND